MKQLRYIIYALAVIALTTACQDEYDITDSAVSEQNIRVTGSLSEDADTRLAYTVGESSVTCAWAAGDTIALFSSRQTTPVLYVAKTDGTTTEFEALGDAISVSEGDTVYPWAPYQSSASNTYPSVRLPNIRNQYYNGGTIPSDLDFVYASAQVSDGELHFGFDHLFAFLHLRIAASWLSGYLGVSIGSSGSSERPAYSDGATYDLTTETLTTSSSQGIIYNVDSTTISANSVLDCYVAIRPISAGDTINFSKKISSTTYTVIMLRKSVPDTGLLPGHVYTTTLGEIDDDGDDDGDDDDDEDDSVDERDILIEFYNATNGDNWTDNTNWCTDANLSEWYGVTVSNGHVTRLSLTSNNLTGEIPESIGKLSNLTRLWLSTNDGLTGEIPESIGDLSNLTNLALIYNNLTGEIPESIGNLSNLTNLSLYYNELTGGIPESIGNLTNLTYLSLNHNELTGGIPESIGNLTNLTNLSLGGNDLTGEIPESICNLSNLTTLNLGYNELTGEIPGSIGNLSDLTYLNLNYNELTGEIPESIGNLSNLTTLYLYGDELTGEIPESITKLDKLTHMGLSYNNLTGKIPESIGNMSSLKNIVLCGNSLTGEIPESIGDLSNLEVFQFTGGELSGEIPESIGNLTNLQTLNLYGSNLTGNLPVSMANLNSLTSINLLYNRLSGVVPTEIVNCTWWANLGFSTILTQQSGYGLTLPEDYDVYTSTDYSEDGNIYTLQTHTKGDGMKFFILGEAFSDRLIADGTYKGYVDLAYEAMFTEEPFASYKDYFDVYYVNVVSENEYIGGSTAFETTYGSSESLSFDYSLVEKYIKNLSESGGSVTNTVGIVIVNGDNTTTRSITLLRSDGFSAAYCITGDDDDDFKELIHHEALGHGFANLADEYVEYSSTFTGASTLSAYQTNYNFYLNVDTTNDKDEVLWSYYLTDSNYDAEGIGIYEGAYHYYHGVYRSTETSIMRYNTGGFNAPSRQEIFRRIITRSGGTYSFEDFLEYDLINCKAYSSGIMSRSSGKTRRALPGAPPQVVTK